MKTNNTKLQESITLQRRVIAGYEQTISENKTRRQYFIALGDYKQVAKMEQIINRDEQESNELKKQLNAMEAELNTTTPADNTPTTMNANGTTEFSELTHAGQCLDIYLHNTSDIYERYTVPAINAVVEAVRRNGWQLPKEEAIKNLTFWTSWQDGTKKALQAAARLVKRYDHLTPTAKDIEQVTRNYAAYIVDCAKYEIENA